MCSRLDQILSALHVRTKSRPPIAWIEYRTQSFWSYATWFVLAGLSQRLRSMLHGRKITSSMPSQPQNPMSLLVIRGTEFCFFGLLKQLREYALVMDEGCSTLWWIEMLGVVCADPRKWWKESLACTYRWNWGKNCQTVYEDLAFPPSISIHQHLRFPFPNTNSA